MAGDKEKKQVPLRLSKALFDELMKWAEDDFRSLNGQIEYLLTDCVRKRRRADFGLSDSEKKQDGTDKKQDKKSADSEKEESGGA